MNKIYGAKKVVDYGYEMITVEIIWLGYLNKFLDVALHKISDQENMINFIYMFAI
jgi:hypothetical protein